MGDRYLLRLYLKSLSLLNLREISIEFGNLLGFEGKAIENSDRIELLECLSFRQSEETIS